MKKILAMMLALVLCCALIPVTAESADLIGTWYISHAQAGDAEIQVVDPEAIVLTVNEDGSFSMASGSFGSVQAGTWAVADDAISLTANESTTEFRISGDELVYEMGTTSVYLSRTPAAPVPLPVPVIANSADDFAGTWVPCAQIMMGLYMSLNADQVAAAGKLLIEGETVTLLMDDGSGEMIQASQYQLSFADGNLSGEENSIFPTSITISLLEDGTLCYHAVVNMGGMEMETISLYIPDDPEIIAKLPEPGWVLDSVNGALWQDDRASLELFLEDTDNYKVLISWGSSAWETREWVYACDYEAETQTLHARYLICDDVVYDEAGNESRTNVFEGDSEAVFSLNEEGKILLENAGDEQLEGKTFEKIGFREEFSSEIP